jgi:hypothetical protein
MLFRQNGRLCCINLDGQVIFRYNISGDEGLAVDRQGHAYIGGLLSNNIKRLSPDGTFHDIVLSERDGIDVPMCITFNNDFTKLFVISRKGTCVLVYSCKWWIVVFCKQFFFMKCIIIFLFRHLFSRTYNICVVLYNIQKIDHFYQLEMLLINSILDKLKLPVSPSAMLSGT